ncbi:4285_t:CDS:1, partial [Racocetra fulgida]
SYCNEPGNMIIELLKKMGIGQKLLGVTTDNAVNMLAMGRVLKEKMNNEFSNPNIQHFRCGAYVLNIIVEEGIKSVSKEVFKAREFFMKLRNSPSLIRELKKIFELKNVLFLMPKMDVDTRWNSMYIMLEKLQRIRPITDILVVSNQTLKPNYPNEQEWKIIFV